MKKLLTILAILVAGSLSMLGLAQAEEITIKGSTTVLPIAQATAEIFMDQNSDVDISVQGGGSGVGIASIIDGTADIGDASRAIKDKELSAAVSAGVNPKAHVVAMDGIAVVIHPSNGITALSKQQVKDIYTGKITDWSKVGGNPGEIVVVSRDSASGTYEAFHGLALNKEKFSKKALREASNQAVVKVVSTTPGAIGYAGLGYLTNQVKTLTIEGVIPTVETVLSGEYAYARPLFMYTNGAPKGVVKKYLDFIKSKEGQKIVSEQGFVALK